MNKNRHPMDSAARKKAHKEIKRGQKLFLQEKEPEAKSDKITPEKILKRYPKKIAKAETGLLATLKKALGIKKKKRLSPHSKRTTPGEVIGQPAAPASTHVEGKKWTKTVNLQNKVKRKLLSAKLNKKH